MKPSTILCCDWGSSSFRLSLVRVQDQAILHSHQQATGIAQTFQEWQQTKDLSRTDHYFLVLRRAVDQLAKDSGHRLDRVPMLISGMASSSIGIRELPYATLPFHLNGERLIVEQFEPTDRLPHPVWLISGVRSEQDVMRGEEIQAIGLTRALGSENGVYIFPGTHSKHILIENDHILEFKTYMTGELFQVASRHTMLRASVSAEPAGDLEKNALYFAKGVEKAQISNYLHALFTLRTNQLLHQFTPSQNFYYHSGLHIGYELKALSVLASDLRIFLCGDRHLTPYYERAFHTLGWAERLTVIPLQTMALAAVYGMLHVFKSRPPGAGKKAKNNTDG